MLHPYRLCASQPASASRDAQEKALDHNVVLEVLIHDLFVSAVFFQLLQ